MVDTPAAPATIVVTVIAAAVTAVEGAATAAVSHRKKSPEESTIETYNWRVGGYDYHDSYARRPPPPPPRDYYGSGYDAGYAPPPRSSRNGYSRFPCGQQRGAFLSSSAVIFHGGIFIYDVHVLRRGAVGLSCK